jgi:hypothetical protein
MSTTSGVVLVAAGVFGSVGVMGGLWSEDSPVTASAEARTVPALVAAEASEYPDQGTLVITATDQPHQFVARVERGAGSTLERASSLYRLRPAEAGMSTAERAQLVAQIVQPTSADPRPKLEEQGIRFILFQGSPDSEAALTMGQRDYLIPSGETDRSVLWAVGSTVAKSPEALPPSPAQSSADLLWLVTWALWGVLALPTERRPQRRSEEGDESSSLQRVLEEDTDD